MSARARAHRVEGTGTYQAVIDKLPYLKRMGFNALELMPIAEFNELECHSDNPVTGEKRYNFGDTPTVLFLAQAALRRLGERDCSRAANRGSRRWFVSVTATASR